MRPKLVVLAIVLLAGALAWGVACQRVGAAPADRSDDVRQACQKLGEDERLALLTVGMVVRDADDAYHAEVTGQVPGGARTYRCEARVVDGKIQATLADVATSPIALPPTPHR